jgi:hypothetical protein
LLSTENGLPTGDRVFFVAFRDLPSALTLKPLIEPRLVDAEGKAKRIDDPRVGQARSVELVPTDQVTQRKRSTEGVQVVQHAAQLELKTAELSVRVNTAAQVPREQQGNCLLLIEVCQGRKRVDRQKPMDEEVSKALDIGGFGYRPQRLGIESPPRVQKQRLS